MQTVTSKITTSFREKGSKFIGHLMPAMSVEDFDESLQKIKSTYPDATHHCYGWRLDPHKIREFAQDDGEPGGTAGLPILNKLKSRKMINCGCVVVRYYGGTNLGKSGLINAYGQSAELCLEKAVIEKLIPTINFKIRYPYGQQKQINQLKNSFDLKELEATYTESVTLDIACRLEEADNFYSALQKLDHLGIEAESSKKGFVTIPK